jgi:hypothetical protein
VGGGPRATKSLVHVDRPVLNASRHVSLPLVSNHVLSSRSYDRTQHSLGFRQDIIIADPKHRKSLLLPEESLSLGIFLPAVIMTSTIDLDNEGDLVAEEIHDVATHWLLAAKFQ